MVLRREAFPNPRVSTAAISGSSQTRGNQAHVAAMGTMSRGRCNRSKVKPPEGRRLTGSPRTSGTCPSRKRRPASTELNEARNLKWNLKRNLKLNMTSVLTRTYRRRCQARGRTPCGTPRIRDKIAASKRKGLWVGGMVPLGYQTVRTIFRAYLRVGSLKPP